MRGLLAAVVLAWASPASALDWDALEAAHRGDDQVILERDLRFEFEASGDLRVTDRVRRAILREAAREDLRTWTHTDRPGCGEVLDLDVLATAPDGTEHRRGFDEVLWGPEGDHPLDPERSSRTGTIPRPSVVPRAVVEESVVIRYTADCYGGLVSTSRAVGAEEVDVVKETIEVVCADGTPCHADLKGPASLERTDTGWRLDRTDLAAPATEPSAPPRAHRGTTVFVASSADPLAPATALWPKLEAARRAWGKRVGTAKTAAKANCEHVDGLEGLVCWLTREVPVAGEDDYWIQGFDWGGDPPDPTSRPLLPLEWWGLGWALLRSYDATPVLVDLAVAGAPPDVAAVTFWDRVGFLVPGVGLVTYTGVDPEFGGAVPSLAGRSTLELGESPRVVTHEVDPATSSETWTGTLIYDGDGPVFRYEVDWRNETGQDLRNGANWEIFVNEWRVKRNRPGYVKTKKLGTWIKGERIKKRLAALVGRPLMSAHIVRPEPDDGGGARGMVRFRGPDVWDKREGFVLLRIPLELPEALGALGDDGGSREHDYRFDSMRRTVRLDVAAPRGYVLAGLPSDLTAAEGPLRVAATFERGDAGHVLVTVDIEADGPIASVEQRDAVQAAVRALQQLEDLRLLYVAAASAAE